MTNRYPLIINSITGSIEELAAGDNLNLTSSGVINAGSIQATSFAGDGSAITNINGLNVTGSVPFADLVITNAQPNITSTGTLTGLSINGVANLGNISNIHINGGSANNVIITNGSGNLSWAAQSGGGGSAGLQDIFLLGGM